MARKTVNRMALRRDAEGAEADGEKAAVKKKAKAVRPKRKTSKKRSEATGRFRIRWAVYNGSMKEVASFDYGQRKQADAKAAELNAKAKSVHFVQAVKEPVEEKES